VLDLENKKVLVSGSSNGLGLKIVEKFSENGSIGFGFDIQESSLDIKKWDFLKKKHSKWLSMNSTIILQVNLIGIKNKCLIM